MYDGDPRMRRDAGWSSDDAPAFLMRLGDFETSVPGADSTKLIIYIPLLEHACISSSITSE